MRKKAIEAEVKTWLDVNIHTWLEEHPDWFNEHKMFIIAEDYIDDPETLARIRTRYVKKMIQERRGNFMARALT